MNESAGTPICISAEFEPTPPPLDESYPIHIPRPTTHRFRFCELTWVPRCWRVVCVACGDVFSYGHGAVKILYKFWGLLLMRLQRPTRRDLGELVHILVINDEVWNDELEALLKRVKRLSEPSAP